MKVVIAAAGTGGHINPGIAMANKIMQEEPDSKIIFIGTTRGLENDLVPRAGYELKHIDSYGISRELSIKNIKRLYKTYKSIGEAKKILKDFKPDIVIGTGGYICISVGEAAKRLKIPVILHESNAFPGVAVKLLSKYAEKILLGFEEAKNRLPKANKLVVTGTPTKIKKINYSDQEKKEKLDSIQLKDKKLPIVLVFGGSQGAQSINNAILGIVEQKLNTNYQIIWAAGKGNYEQVKNELATKNIDIDSIENAKILPYIYNMQEMMNIADLVVCRSGAMTISEITILEKPAIFIPFPFAAENHQEYNARVLEKIGAAKIILDKDLNAQILNNQIGSIVANASILQSMGKNAGKIKIENVEDKIYSEIKESLNGR